MMASLAKWLSVRLRTKGCGFESRCCHLIIDIIYFTQELLKLHLFPRQFRGNSGDI